MLHLNSEMIQLVRVVALSVQKVSAVVVVLICGAEELEIFYQYEPVEASSAVSRTTICDHLL